jgi:hypothetical protein
MSDGKGPVVLIVRAWIEAGHAGGLRVRVTQVDPDRRAELVTRVSTTVDGACDIVRTRLEAFLQDEPSGP